MKYFKKFDVHFGDGILSGAPDLQKRALDALEWEIRAPDIYPNLNRFRSQKPHLAMIHDEGNKLIGRALGRGTSCIP